MKEPSYCTESDLRSILPTIADYDKKRKITGWIKVNDDRKDNLHKAGSTGSIQVLYRKGIELNQKDSKAECVDDGDWNYDSDLDEVYLRSANPTSMTISAGVDWSTLVNDVISKSSEFVRMIVGKPIIKHRWGERDYDEVIVSGTAAIAVGRLVRPHNEELADRLERYYNYDGIEYDKGLLQKVRDGEINLSNEVTPSLGEGKIVEQSVDETTTGGIADIEGKPTGNDTVKVVIETDGDFSYGTESAIKYSVYVKGSTGLMTERVVDNQIINGDYQTLAHGLRLKFHIGKYTANDTWYIEMSKDTIESHQSVKSIPVTVC